jgi:hypothetical protein
MARRGDAGARGPPPPHGLARFAAGPIQSPLSSLSTGGFRLAESVRHDSFRSWPDAAFSGNGRESDQPPPKPSEVLPQGSSERSGSGGEPEKKREAFGPNPLSPGRPAINAAPRAEGCRKRNAGRSFGFDRCSEREAAKGQTDAVLPRDLDRMAFGPFLEGSRGEPEKDSDILRRGTIGTDRGRKASAGTGLGGSAHALTGTGCQVRDSGGRRQRRPPFRFGHRGPRSGSGPERSQTEFCSLPLASVRHPCAAGGRRA